VPERKRAFAGMPEPSGLRSSFSRLPLELVADLDQGDVATGFQASGPWGRLRLGPSRVSLSAHPETARRDRGGKPVGRASPDKGGLATDDGRGRDAPPAPAAGAVELSFPGARPDVVPEGEERLPGVVNYFLGDDPGRWRRNVPTYGAVRYADLYPAIDLVFHAADGH